MKITNFLIIVFISLFVASCSKVADPVKEIGLGSKVIKYQDEEKVDSLVLPPNLTEPDIKGDFSKVVQLGEVEIAKKNVAVSEKIQEFSKKVDLSTKKPKPKPKPKSKPSTKKGSSVKTVEKNEK